MKCQDLHRKLMFGNLQIGKSWGQFTNIFSLTLHYLVHWAPTSKCFVVMWRIGKHEYCKFKAISIKNWFKSYGPMPLHMGCRLPNIKFCKFLVISRNFHLNDFRELCLNALWSRRNRKHDLYIQMNFHHELAPQPTPLAPWVGVARYELCAILDISCNS